MLVGMQEVVVNCPRSEEQAYRQLEREEEAEGRKEAEAAPSKQ